MGVIYFYLNTLTSNTTSVRQDVHSVIGPYFFNRKKMRRQAPLERKGGSGLTRSLDIEFISKNVVHRASKKARKMKRGCVFGNYTVLF